MREYLVQQVVELISAIDDPPGHTWIETDISHLIPPGDQTEQ
jgi:hypothetical protein